MRIEVIRTNENEKATLGELYVDGLLECYTLEDVVRPAGVKIPGVTAIPGGMCPVIITYSMRFKRPMPLLVGVPNFEGVRIHYGNTDADTEGCILVGRTVMPPDFVGESRVAFFALFAKLTAAINSGNKVMLSIGEAGT